MFPSIPPRNYELAKEHWTKFNTLMERYQLLHDTMCYSQFNADSAVVVCQFVSHLIWSPCATDDMLE